MAGFGTVAALLTLVRVRVKALRPLVVPFEMLAWLGALYSFFTYRDPPRHTQQPDPHYIFAPADGRVAALETDVREPNFIGGAAEMLTIAQQPLDVHIYRSPIAGRVEYILSQVTNVLETPKTLIGVRVDEAAVQAAIDAGRGRARIGTAAIQTGTDARRIAIAVYTLPCIGSVPNPFKLLLQPAHIRAHAAHSLIQQDIIGVGRPFVNSSISLFAQPGEIEWLVRLGQHVQAGQTIVGRFRPRA